MKPDPIVAPVQRSTMGVCGGCGYGCNVSPAAGWQYVPDVVVIPVGLYAEYHRRVETLLAQLSMLDPTNGPTRHPEWPLRMHGDADVVAAFCANLKGFGLLHRALTVPEKIECGKTTQENVNDQETAG